MNKDPIAVLISDIHFNINTLEIASKALTAALNRAETLKVPLIIVGDLHDTKAIIRAEIANRLIEILKDAKTNILILEGNHDKINEKGIGHGLNYLKPYAHIIDAPAYDWDRGLLYIPYYSDSQALSDFIKGIKSPVTLIMHQGFKGAWMGDYVQDKTSLDPEAVKHLKVISGHYHKHQAVGTVTYIGSPYTITFGEANDGPKGFLVLNSDGSYTREILNLRKHVIIEKTIEELDTYAPTDIENEDLIWLKIKGPESQLKKLNKKELGAKLFGHNNFKLDLIFNIGVPVNFESPITEMTETEILDTLIENIKDTDEQKAYLKGLYREILES